MDTQNVGKRIAKLRKEQALTQKDLAAILHVTDKAVSKWERGINFPELTLLEPLAGALDTDILHLLCLEDSTPQAVANSISAISEQEKAELIKQLRFRSYVKLVIEAVIWFCLLYSSWLFNNLGIYGTAQIATMGMLGFASTLFSWELYTLRQLPKLS